MEEETNTRRSGMNHLAFGSLILGWGILLVLKQIGIITVSTIPFVFTAFGGLLVVSGVAKLRRSRNIENAR